MIAVRKLEISDYYSIPEGSDWKEIPEIVKGQVCFLNKKIGLQLIMSIIEGTIIHVSVNTIRPFREDLTKEQHNKIALDISPSIIDAFFNGMEFKFDKADDVTGLFYAAHYLHYM